MDTKLKHLEIINNVINRLGHQSFLIKGWALTLVSALLAVSLKESSAEFLYITFLPVLMFWVLDSIFLRTERSFRCLYDEVRIKNSAQVDFSMDITLQKKKIGWLKVIASPTLLIFYGVMICVLIIVG